MSYISYSIFIIKVSRENVKTIRKRMFTTMMGVFKVSHPWGRWYYDIKQCRCSTGNYTRRQKQCENVPLFCRYEGSHSGSAEQRCGFGSLDTERTCHSRKRRTLGPWSHRRQLSHGGLGDPLGSGPQPQTAYMHVWRITAGKPESCIYPSIEKHWNDYLEMSGVSVWWAVILEFFFSSSKKCIHLGSALPSSERLGYRVLSKVPK